MKAAVERAVSGDAGAFDCDVLIVGGGPVGLFLATELGQRGIRVQLYDAKPGTSRHPAANANSARTMEHFRRIGIADAVRMAGLPRDFSPDIAYFTSVAGYELARLKQPPSGQAVRWAQQNPLVWPTAEPPHRCSQLYIEPILLDAARRQPSCSIEFSSHVESFEQDTAGVTARITLEATDTRPAGERRVRARYLVGCDGPRSMVRRQMGVRYGGVGGQKREFMGGQMEAVYFHAPDLYNVSAHAPAWQYWTFGEKQRALLISVDGAGHFIMNVQLRDGEAVDQNTIQRRIATAIGVDIPFTIKSQSSWTAGHALVSERLVDRRTFIAGDAAHLFTPTGGLGYNTGIDDAANLAWKLSALVRGVGGSELAESYHAERHPAALRNTDFASRFADSIGHAPVPDASALSEDGGETARRALGEYLAFHAYHEFMIPGVHLGTRYEASPLVEAEAGAPPADLANRYLQSARPGHRAPHLWLEDGGSLYDRFGAGFTLLCSGAGERDEDSVASACGALPRLNICTVPDVAVRDAYEADFTLIRPDQHVAWRGNALDAAFQRAIQRTIGHGGRRDPYTV